MWHLSLLYPNSCVRNQLNSRIDQPQVGLLALAKLLAYNRDGDYCFKTAMYKRWWIGLMFIPLVDHCQSPINEESIIYRYPPVAFLQSGDVMIEKVLIYA
jgi:hypothetical protein